MAIYDLILKLEKLDYYTDLLKKDIIPSSLLDCKVIYEFYQNLIKEEQTGKINRTIKRQAKKDTALEFGISERNVYHIIQKIEA